MIPAEDTLISWVDQAKDGNKHAFSRLIATQKRTIYALCLKYVRDPDLAEDLAQEAFIKAHRKLNALKQSARFPEWLRSIASNGCLTHLRRNRCRLGEHADVPVTRMVSNASESDWIEHDAFRENLTATLRMFA